MKRDGDRTIDNSFDVFYAILDSYEAEVKGTRYYQQSMNGISYSNNIKILNGKETLSLSIDDEGKPRLVFGLARFKPNPSRDDFAASVEYNFNGFVCSPGERAYNFHPDFKRNDHFEFRIDFINRAADIAKMLREAKRDYPSIQP